jgi:methylmalonyl-CoA epimerase
MEFDHIGIVVEQLADAARVYDALGLEIGKLEEMAELDVKIQFVQAGDCLVELIEPTDAQSSLLDPLAETDDTAFLHHIAFRVADIETRLAELRSVNIPLADEQPRPGAGDSQIAFLAREAAHGVPIELVERPSELEI